MSDQVPTFGFYITLHDCQRCTELYEQGMKQDTHGSLAITAMANWCSDVEQHKAETGHDVLKAVLGQADA
jgi:hypothetical protein